MDMGGVGGEKVWTRTFIFNLRLMGQEVAWRGRHSDATETGRGKFTGEGVIYYHSYISVQVSLCDHAPTLDTLDTLDPAPLRTYAPNPPSPR